MRCIGGDACLKIARVSLHLRTGVIAEASVEDVQLPHSTASTTARQLPALCKFIVRCKG